MEESKDKFNKPGFDARQHYYNILTGMIKGISQFSYDEDFKSWFKIIKQMSGLVSPFIEPTNKEKLKASIKKIDNMITIRSSCQGKANRNMLDDNLSNALQDITDDIYSYARHMLLPIKISDEGEYNSEDFFGGSAL